jgi:hypothetical protein
LVAALYLLRAVARLGPRGAGPRPPVLLAGRAVLVGGVLFGCVLFLGGVFLGGVRFSWFVGFVELVGVVFLGGVAGPSRAGRDALAPAPRRLLTRR